MFVGERLVYLQLQKTGCTQVAKLLRECIPGVQIGKHNRLRSVDESKLVVGSIRNPWDWYVSLWAFGCSGRGGFLHQLVNSAHGARWRETYADYMDACRFRRWLRQLFDPRFQADVGDGFARSSVSSIAGLLTYRYLTLYSRDLAVVTSPRALEDMGTLRAFDAVNNVLGAVIRTDRLERDLIHALEIAGYAISDDQRRRIHSARKNKENASKHRATSTYYTPETLELVRRRESLIATKYEFESMGCAA